MDHHHIESIQKVLSKPTVHAFCFERLVGRRDDTGIGSFDLLTS